MALFEFLERAFGASTKEEPVSDDAVDRHKLAAAALLVEAGMLDGQLEDVERQRIIELLEQHFGLDQAAANALFERAEKEAEDSVEWHGFTKLVKEGFDQEGRVELIEMLWEVAYADGQLHDYEASLIRRVTGLLYVSDYESGEARKRVRARLGI